MKHGKKLLSVVKKILKAQLHQADRCWKQFGKFILDKNGASYDEHTELPKLYKAAAEKLNLAPSQHTEQIFKQILGGCQSVVEGLGALRNKLGDAHGGGQSRVKPSKRHAELAVNLAGNNGKFSRCNLGRAAKEEIIKISAIKKPPDFLQRLLCFNRKS